MFQKVLKMTVLFGKFLEKCWKNRVLTWKSRCSCHW